MRSTEHARSLSLQASHALISRLDALTGWASTQADLAPTGLAKRSDVHRAALYLGLRMLEGRADDASAAQVASSEAPTDAADLSPGQSSFVEA